MNTSSEKDEYIFDKEKGEKTFSKDSSQEDSNTLGGVLVAKKKRKNKHKNKTKGLGGLTKPPQT